MILSFSKYQGAGNDFIIIDNRDLAFPSDNFELIKRLCHRRFGIGADGLMLLESSNDKDFSMRYYNSDGPEGSMCGNGGRCIVAFAHKLGVIDKSADFSAIDGMHNAIINDIKDNQIIVDLEMSDVNDIQTTDCYSFLNTGSPHYVEFVSNVNSVDVVDKGREIRYSELFKGGTNVNFVESAKDHLFVRTYERGVEDETLACGTGVTASVLAAVANNIIENTGEYNVKTLGGDLSVKYNFNEGKFNNIRLIGPATHVFDGTINI